MRVAVITFALALFIWSMNRPIAYFIMGPEVGRLAPHLRMSSGQSGTECALLLKDWQRAFPSSGACCERTARWNHWFNLARNFIWQIDDYLSRKRSLNR